MKTLSKKGLKNNNFQMYLRVQIFSFIDTESINTPPPPGKVHKVEKPSIIICIFHSRPLGMAFYYSHRQDKSSY